MSSTSNAQDLLVNVFRPTYRWDSNTGFVPSLVISNVSEIITGSLQTGALVVSDTGNNTYIGSNAGLRASNTSYNVGLGYSAMGAAINSSNNVAVGYYALDGVNNSTSNVIVGAYSGIVSSNGGTRNVLVGPNVTIAGGTGNILIGTDISLASVSNRLQLGRLIYGDLRSGFIGVNLTDPSGAFDVSGTTFFRGKVGIQTTEESPKYSLDVNGSIYANNRFFGGLGSLMEPLYSFDAASNSGMYVPPASAGYGPGAFAIAVNQKPAAIFSDGSVNFFQNLDVSGTFSARAVNIDAFAVTSGTRAVPTITFTSYRSDGFYHLAGMDGFSAVTLGQDRMMFLGSGDISSARILGSDISLSGAIFTNSGCNVVGGVTLSNGNVILTGTATNSNLLVPGWIRDNETAPVVDISDGTVQAIKFRAQNGSAPIPAYSFSSDPSSGMHLVRTSAIGFDTAGIQRMCISGGFVGIGTSAPRVALDVSGDISANVYNGPGGTALAPHYTFSDDRTTGLFFPGANMIGLTAGGTERVRISNGFVGIGTTPSASSALDVSGVFRIIGANGNITFNNGTIDVSGTPLVSTTGAFSNAATTTSNYIGGVTLSNFDVSLMSSGRFRTMTGTSNYIGGVTLSNFDVSLMSSGRVMTMPTGTSNYIGGVTLSNFDVSLMSSGRFRTMTGSSNYIGGVTLSNFDVSLMSTGRFMTMPTNSSNYIGGVTLSNFDVSLMSSGQFRTMPTGSSNYIGGVTLSNFDVSLMSTGRFITMPTGSSNYIGGVTLSNFDVSLMSSGRFMTMTGSSNYIGGVTLSNFDVSLMSSGRFMTMPTGSSNYIGGVTLSNFDVSLTSTGRILGFPTSSNQIGGVILSNSNVFTGNGSATGPSHTFINDPSTGLHLAGVSRLVFDTSGVQRMCISGGNVGIGSTITAPFSALDLSDGTLSFRRRAGFSRLSSNNTASIEIGGGYNNAGAGQVNGAFPAIAFGFWEGGYRHFIRSRHSGGIARNSGIDFLINTGLGDASSTTIGVNNSNMLSVTAAGVGVGMDLPLGALDVSGSIRVGCLTGNELTTNAGSIEIGGGLNGNNVGGLPAIAFQGRDTVGGFGYRHFIQTAHSGGVATTGNAIRFFICSGGPVGQSTAPGVGSTHIMSVTQQGVGIGTPAPTGGLDVSFASTSVPAFRVTNVAIPTQGWGGRNNHTVDISGGVRIVQDASLVGPLNNDPRGLFDTLTLQSSRGQGSNGSASIAFRSGLDNNFYGRIFGVDRQPIPGGAYIGDLVFQTANGVGFLPEVMRLTWNGRVGIGTTDPQFLLDVNGTIAANSNEYTVYMTTSGVGQSLTTPTGFSNAHITIVSGGGGGGAGGLTSGGGGGASGGFISALATNISGTTFTIAIGAGGVGGITGINSGRGGFGAFTSVAYGNFAQQVEGGNPGFGGNSGTGGAGGAGIYGGGGAAAQTTPGAGGVGKLIDGATGTTTFSGSGGGSANNAVLSTAGGGGGGPLGGRGGGSSAPTAGGAGSGGGGAAAAGTGAAGGAGYVIFKFLR